jgi:hypothetical protein
MTQRGDVVLARFPFTDQIGTKSRIFSRVSAGMLLSAMLIGALMPQSAVATHDIAWYTMKEWQAAINATDCFDQTNGDDDPTVPEDWGLPQAAYSSNDYPTPPYPQAIKLVNHPICTSSYSGSALHRAGVLSRYALLYAVKGRQQAIDYPDRGEPGLSFQRAYGLYMLATNALYGFFFTDREMETGAWWDYLWIPYYALASALLDEYHTYSDWSRPGPGCTRCAPEGCGDRYWATAMVYNSIYYAFYDNSDQPKCTYIGWDEKEHDWDAPEENGGHAMWLMISAKFCDLYIPASCWSGNGRQILDARWASGVNLTNYVCRPHSDRTCPTLDNCNRINNWFGPYDGCGEHCYVASPDYGLDALGLLGTARLADGNWTPGMLRTDNKTAYLNTIYGNGTSFINAEWGHFQNIQNGPQGCQEDLPSVQWDMACSENRKCGWKQTPCEGGDCPDPCEDWPKQIGYIYPGGTENIMTNAKGCDATWFTHGMAFSILYAERKDDPTFRNTVEAYYKALIEVAATGKPNLTVPRLPLECTPAACFKVCPPCVPKAQQRVRTREELCSFQAAYHAVAYLMLDGWTIQHD